MTKETVKVFKWKHRYYDPYIEQWVTAYGATGIRSNGANHHAILTSERSANDRDTMLQDAFDLVYPNCKMQIVSKLN